MRQPAFWHRPPGLAAWLLSPLGCVYAGAVKRRVGAGTRRRVGIPVICIGNINVGGTGKTPLAIAFGEHLLAKGANWLSGHPDKELITRRALKHRRSLMNMALASNFERKLQVVISDNP